MAIDIRKAVGEIISTSTGKIHLVDTLGRGKSGYSYLGEFPDSAVVVKLMHNEPNPYYSFGENNKVEIEVNAYQILSDLGIPLPKLISFDLDQNFLVKEFIDGIKAVELIASDEAEAVLEQLYRLAGVAKNAHINLDYFPANFIIREGGLHYIDYEYNPYDPAWDLNNWGIFYWANSAGMRQFLETGDSRAINQSVESGIPIKEPFISLVDKWNNKYGRI